MADFESRWMTFYAAKVEPFYKEMISHIEKLIIGTLIVSAGAHVSSDEPSIQLFGYLRHSLVGRGVMLIGVIILALNFIDGLYKLAKVNRHLAWQIVMSFFYIAVSVRLIQLILAFRGGDIRTLCAGVAPGGGRIMQCIANRAADLSPACKDVLTPFMAR